MKLWTHLTAATAVSMLPLLTACTADPTGPDGGPPETTPVVMNQLMARMQRVDVTHDCDPNKDNPGDFRAWIEIWQDVDTAAATADMQLVAKTDAETFTIHSDASLGLGDRVRLTQQVVRDGRLPVSVRFHLQERDGGSIDTALDTDWLFRWSDSGDCWTRGGCVAPGGSTQYRYATEVREFSRDDEFHLFNPDDEGCDFTMAAEVMITDS